MKKLFISVSMNGRSDKDIQSDIDKMKMIAESEFNEKFEVLDTFKAPDVTTGNIRVDCLGRSIRLLSQADYYIGFKNPSAKGCIIENNIVTTYDWIPSLFIDNDIDGSIRIFKNCD